MSKNKQNHQPRFKKDMSIPDLPVDYMSMNEKPLDKEIASIKAAMNSPDLCKGTASTYTRVSGYFIPVRDWCGGKAQEYRERKEYIL